MDITARLANGDSIPTWLYFTFPNKFSGTPPADAETIYTVVVVATDALGQTGEASFTITVGFNNTPVISRVFDDVQLSVGQAWIINLSATTDYNDVDDDPLTLLWALTSGANLPSWITVSDNGNTLSGTPLDSDVGEIELWLRVKDDRAAYDEKKFKIVINTPPVANEIIETATAYYESEFKYFLKKSSFVDPDGGVLSYTAKLSNGSALPEYLSFVEFNHSFVSTKIPTVEELGGASSIDIEVTVTDEFGATASQTFSIQFFATEDTSSAVAVGVTVSAGVVLLGAPLAGLAIFKIVKARAAFNAGTSALNSALKAPSAAAPGGAAPSTGPVQAQQSPDFHP